MAVKIQQKTTRVTRPSPSSAFDSAFVLRSFACFPRKFICIRVCLRFWKQKDAAHWCLSGLAAVLIKRRRSCPILPLEHQSCFRQIIAKCMAKQNAREKCICSLVLVPVSL